MIAYDFMITNGLLHFFAASELIKVVKGQPRNLTLKAGDYFGHEVMVDQQKYAATVVSMSTFTGWKIDRAVLSQTVPMDKLRQAH